MIFRSPPEENSALAQTLSEKILHAGREVKAGEMVVVPVDLILTQDGTGPLAVRQVEKMVGRKAAIPNGGLEL